MTTRRTFLKQLGMIGALASLFPGRLLDMFVPKQMPLLRGMEVPGHKVLKPEALAQGELTKDNILEHIIECGRVLDEQAVPRRPRWIYISENMYKELRA